MITVRELNRALLARQYLLEPTNDPPLTVIRKLIALQAQATHPPYTALWSRLTQFTPAVLDDLVIDKQVVRLVLFRSTIQLVATEDAMPLRRLLDPMLSAGFSPAWRTILAGADVDAIIRHGIEITTAEPHRYSALGARLAQKFDLDPRLLAQLLRNRVPMVAVPPSALWGDGKPASYQPAANWLGDTPSTAMDHVDLLRRYLAAYGPATAADISVFTGLSGFPAAMRSLADELITVDGPTGSLYDLIDAPRPPADTPAPVRLLAEWDSMLLAHQDRSRIVQSAAKPVVYTKNGVMPGTVLVDGFVAGTYRWRATPATATLTLQPLRRWTKREMTAARREGEKFLEFAAPGRDHHIDLIE